MNKLLIVILCLFTFGCAFSRQDLSNANLISLGMTKQKVLSIMGTEPVRTSFNQDIEEWHYCKTGSGSDSFIAIIFSTRNQDREPRVVAKEPYGGAFGYGDCANFVKTGIYKYKN